MISKVEQYSVSVYTNSPVHAWLHSYDPINASTLGSIIYLLTQSQHSHEDLIRVRYTRL